MASRFWAGSSSSEEESDVSDVSDVETSQQQQARAASRWAVQSDSDSEEEVRVVKSAKDKALENMENKCSGIKNHMKINDWTQIQTEFDDLVKLLERAKKSLNALPTFYLRTMVALEDFLGEKVKNKAEQKKMSKENSKALIRMKGKIKKQLEPIRKQIDDFRANPVDSSEDESSSSSESESSSSESSSSESESSKASSSASEASSDESESEEESSDDDKSGSDDDSDDSDKSWPSNSSSSSSSSEDDDNMPKGRARWLKQTPVVTKAKKVKGPKVVKQREARRDSVDEVKKVAVEEELKLTPSQFDRRVKEVVAMRGKKGMDLSEQLSLMRKLANYARRLGPARQIVATMYLVGTSVFDTSSKIDRVMSARHWKQVQTNVCSILSLLEKNPDFSLAPLTSEDQADIVRAGREKVTAAQIAAAAAEDAEEDMNFVDTLPAAGKKGTIKVSGDLAAFVDRLSEEYTKALQQTDPHTSEYVGRLYDENLLIEVAERVQTFYARKKDFQRAAGMALVRAELIYYKHDTVAAALYEAQAKRAKFGDPVFLHPACTSTNAAKATEFDVSTVHPGSVMGQPSVDVTPVDAEKLLRDVCRFVFQYGDIRAKTRAMLCRIYHHALHDRFHEARDLLLMSHIQDNITDADIPTQILFNRMMAQLGLCAFRSGLIWEAHACLSEICTGSRTKELLAQGLQSFRYGERDLEQERLERRRQVPYHMHINLDLLESSHLVSAMLLEVPNMVNSRLSDRKRMVSKAFRKLLEFHERLVFEGPPENPRDHVVAAAKLLAQGSWRKSAELLVGLPVWDLFPGSNVSQRVKAMIQHKIQVEALRTYLLAFSSEYDSVSLARLMETFELDDKTVHSVVSKMMINEELQGAWDQSSQAIVLYKTERSALQNLAVQYSDKLSQIVENNERMMDLRSGTGKEEWGNRRGGGDGRRGGGNRIGFSAGGNRRGDNQGGRGGFRPRRGGGSGGGRGPRQQRQ
jgi:translation initiation factor 3 subunit C